MASSHHLTTSLKYMFNIQIKYKFNSVKKRDMFGLYLRYESFMMLILSFFEDP